MRLLLDPAPAPEGVAVIPVSAAVPAPTPQPVAPVATPPQTVTLPYEQFVGYQTAAADLVQIRAQNQQAEREKLQALAEKQAAEGQWKQASETLRNQHAADLKERDGRAIEWEGRAKSYARDTAIMADLATRANLRPGVAEQLVKLYGDPLKAHSEGPGFAVRTDTFQDVKTYFDAILNDPANSHFLKPSTQGGAGGGGHIPNPTPNPTPTAEAKNLGEAIAQHFLAARQAAGATIGLGRRR